MDGEPVAELVPSRKGFPFGIAREEPLPTLAIRIRHIRKLAGLRELHTHPIDRILVAQALAEGLTLVTKDAMLERYGAPVVWE